MEFNELYQEIILDHYRHPRNKSDLSHISDDYAHENPACGDRIKVEIVVKNDNHIESVFFDGSGCAICMASASMMSELLSNTSREEAQNLISTFIAILRKEKDLTLLDEMGDLTVFKSLVRLPVRVKCATLPWNAAMENLDLKW